MAARRGKQGISAGDVGVSLRLPWVGLLALVSVVLSACEDQGNAGDDNLLTGGSLVLLVIVAIVIFLIVRRRR